MVQRWGNAVAAVFFCLGYAILFTDPSARREMAPWFASTAASLAIVLWDERRAKDLSNAFPEASRTFDVIATAQIAVALHFLRTRWPRKLEALGLAALASAVATVPQIVLSLIDEPRETLEDLPGSLLVLVIMPLPLLLIWRLFHHLKALFDVESGLVLVGIVITFGSALAIAAVVAPLWGSMVLFLALAGALVLQRRDQVSSRDER